MKQVALGNLTPRQRQAYVLRFRRGWRLRRIAKALSITVGSAGELVKRAQFRAGWGRGRRASLRPRPGSRGRCHWRIGRTRFRGLPEAWHARGDLGIFPSPGTPGEAG